MHVTDTQLVEINAGSLGLADGTPIPPVSSIINQGGRNLATSGTQITQPLTTLLKIKQANDVAQAEVKVSREKAQLTGNDVALAVHQVYYKILIAQAHRSATEERKALRLHERFAVSRTGCEATPWCLQASRIADHRSSYHDLNLKPV
jgi:hypothetical protein